ncbi:hypothetical protein C1I95_25770 [Micromonospora craterilacus]|uniref:Uncharacterized protein n=1 Tax=Micromonospora craterilacus TaxID=1655439 RepID=A0A2W2E700_9ACTN|nr:hypothetical protein [Micromonospora craterilacus]PZG12459.1 hypothetical protein C1I95_25770 [Micromonospora craterilacus]
MTTTTVAELVDQMTPEQMRAALHRLVDLCEATSWRGDNIPADGTLIVQTTSGGHQDLPETERVFLRSDLPEDPTDPAYNVPLFWPVGGRTEENAKPRRRQSLGELLWLDDPECDRGDVSLEAFLDVVDILATLCEPNESGE